MAPRCPEMVPGLAEMTQTCAEFEPRSAKIVQRWTQDGPRWQLLPLLLPLQLLVLLLLRPLLILQELLVLPLLLPCTCDRMEGPR